MKLETNHDNLHEQLKFFRNHETAADSHGVVSPHSNEEIIKNHKLKERQRRTEKFGSPEELEQIIINIVNQLNGLKIGDEFKNDKKQQLLLVDKIELTKSLIHGVLIATSRYVQSVEKWDAVKKDKDGYSLENITAADKSRENAHDALISELKSAVRFISLNFSSEVAEEALETWRDEQLDRGQEISEVGRIKFDQKNIIFPDRLNIRNRKHITAWAEQISESLTQIEKLLSEKPKNSL